MKQDIYVTVEHLREKVCDITYVMVAGARELAETTGGRVIGLLLGHQVRELANDLAVDEVLYVQHPSLADFTSDAYQRVLEKLICEGMPRAVLFGDTSVGGDVAGWLSARLPLPLVSHCHGFRTDGDRLLFSSQICGGRVAVEGELPSPTALVMVEPGGYRVEKGRTTQPPPMTEVAPPALDDLRVTVKEYIEPAVGDVDITKEPVLVCVGRGIQSQDNLEMVQELAKALGGEVASSRPVVDQGWLPATRLVGKSGKRVKPKLYLALGVSGAPEHVESITDSDVIVAVNTDASAPIFGFAKYGCTVDMLDLVPALTEKVQQAKS